MLSLLKRLLGRPKPPMRRHDPDFGPIRFLGDPSHGFWSMDGKWAVPFQQQGIACAEIPGDASGPTASARSFLLLKREQPEQIWQLAEPHIRELMSGWPEFQGIEPQEAFHISCLAKDSYLPAGWEVCFETHVGLKWVNFCLQLEGDSVVSNTIYT
jgi:hypothetical protein